MAARAITLDALDIGTPMAAADLKRIFDAIETLSLKQERTSGENKESFATLKAEVGFMSGAVRDLTVKIDRVDDLKAAKSDLAAVEIRVEKSVAEVKAQSTIDASKNNQEWTRRLDSIDEEVREVKDQIEQLNAFRWKMVGACTLASGLASTVIALLFRFLFKG